MDTEHKNLTFMTVEFRQVIDESQVNFGGDYHKRSREAIIDF